MPRHVLILEPDPQRIQDFEQAVLSLGPDYKAVVWRDALSMMEECQAFFRTAVLMSLEFDLRPMPGGKAPPGTGLHLVHYLCGFPRVCPVIIHSSNRDRSWTMLNELRFAGWVTARVPAAGKAWIQEIWLPRAARLVEASAHDPVYYRRPLDHAGRVGHALSCLTGLSVGEAFGAEFTRSRRRARAIRELLDASRLPPAPWKIADPTVMAISLVETLDRAGEVNQDMLARALGERFRQDPRRGYGVVTGDILRRISRGDAWGFVAAGPFDNTGSMGSAAAARVAPLGAYFAGETDRVIDQAALSAEVTQAHPEGKAGAIAVAIAASWAACHRGQNTVGTGSEMLGFCAEHTPQGITRDGILHARTVSLGAPPELAANELGDGTRYTSPDTVPFALWCAARHLDNFEQGLWTAVRALGNCCSVGAILGGILSLSAPDGIPAAWLTAREPLPLLE